MPVNLQDIVNRLDNLHQQNETILSFANNQADAQTHLKRTLKQILDRLPPVPKVTNATKHPYLVLDRLDAIDDRLDKLVSWLSSHPPSTPRPPTT